MAYLQGPYATFTSLPSPTVDRINSSRKINANTRRYELDDNGNNEAMPSTRQRVLLQLDFAVGPPPKFLTERELERRKNGIKAGLKALVDEGAITLDRVIVLEDTAGSTKEIIDYTDLRTGVDETVER